MRPTPSRPLDSRANCKVLLVSHEYYFGTYNHSIAAIRSVMECLTRHGFSATTFPAMLLESDADSDPAAWLAGQRVSYEVSVAPAAMAEANAPTSDITKSYGSRMRDVRVILHQDLTDRPHEAGESERLSFLRLLENTIVHFQPKALVSYGGDALAIQVRRMARDMGVIVVCFLDHLLYRNPTQFADVDVLIAPCRFAASYYRSALGLNCRVLPNLVGFEGVRAVDRDPRYVTFVDPWYDKGVHAFARIADELGRRRPDIPVLVVEGRGTEQTLVDCGLDLRAHGTVHLVSSTSNSRYIWSVTRILIMPSLRWEIQPLVAIEAMANGIPVIGSDRGGIPETLGDAGIILSLPSRLTASTRELPTAREIEPWVKTIIGLWDDPGWYAEQSCRVVAESRRWTPEVLEPQYVQFFETISSRPEIGHDEDPERG